MNIEKIIGRNIKELRKYQGITQDELGEQLDLNKQTISKLERGVFTPSINTLMKICEVLNTTPNELLIDKTSWREWKSDRLEDLDYSLDGIADTMRVFEEERAKIKLAGETEGEEAEIRELWTFIGHFAWTREHLWEVADFVYKKRLYGLVDKTSNELMKNKLNNLQIFEDRKSKKPHDD